jgi:hypothetical protein
MVAAGAGLPLLAPPLALCTDNAAMIAYAGLSGPRGGRDQRHELAARPRWPLDTGAAPLGRVGTQGGQGMTRLAVYGAGAFGSALAMTYAAAGLHVTLWARQGAGSHRRNPRDAPPSGHAFPTACA